MLSLLHAGEVDLMRDYVNGCTPNELATALVAAVSNMRGLVEQFCDEIGDGASPELWMVKYQENITATELELF